MRVYPAPATPDIHADIEAVGTSFRAQNRPSRANCINLAISSSGKSSNATLIRRHHQRPL